MKLTFSSNSSYTPFLTTSFYTTSIRLLKSVGNSTNLSTCKSSTLLLNMFKQIVYFSNLSISNLSASDFTLAKSFSSTL